MRVDPIRWATRFNLRASTIRRAKIVIEITLGCAQDIERFDGKQGFGATIWCWYMVCEGCSIIYKLKVSKEVFLVRYGYD